MNMYMVEFLGTLLFMFVLYMTNHWLAAGAALAVLMLLGGGVYNPAVVLARYSTGQVEKHHVLPMIGAEILGALAAWHVYSKLMNMRK